MATLKHNKKRNIGLVYELLVRHMAARLLENDKLGYSTAVKITKKYFSEGQPLAAEHGMFEAVKSSRGIHINSARRIVMELQRVARQLPIRRNDIKKSNLIKEINYAFPNQGFWEHRIPEYKLLASIQMIIEKATENLPLSESVQKIQLEEAIIRYMTTVDPQKVRRKDEEKVDDLVCSFAVQRFHERYGESLNDTQRSLLEAFTLSSLSAEKGKLLVSHMHKDMELIEDELKKARSCKEIITDSVMRERLEHAIAQLPEMSKLPIEEAVSQLMLYHGLVEELKSNG